jgi:hypothetical protein
MTQQRKRYSAELKAKVAMEAIREHTKHSREERYEHIAGAIVC